MTDSRQTATDQSQDQRRTAANGAATDGTAPEGQGQEPDLAAVIAERDSYLEQLQRDRADFANYRRRTEQERAMARELANRVLLVQLLPVYDDLQRAIAAVPADQRDTPWVEGIGLIERKLWGVLEREGVTPIEALGQPFDPALHEAVAHESGDGPDTVVEVYQNGYRLGPGLLRPAMVKVGPKQAASRKHDVKTTNKSNNDAKSAKSAES